MLQFRVRHDTIYQYSAPVTLCYNVAHLTPRSGPRQQCETSMVMVEPVPASFTERTDYFGNPATHFTVEEPHTRLAVSTEHRVRVNNSPPPVATDTPPWETVRDGLPGRADWLDAYEFTFDSRYAAAGEVFADYAASSFPPGRPILAAAIDLTHRIHTDFEYDPAATTVSTPIAEVLAHRRGVCQDFAHFQVACLRSLGLAARYVSGYLSTVPPPGEPRLIGADATHAWVSVFCGEAGWVDLDPTNNQIPGGRHVLIGWGRDYDDVAPLKGVILGGGYHSVMVSVDVEPLTELSEPVTA